MRDAFFNLLMIAAWAILLAGLPARKCKSDDFVATTLAGDVYVGKLIEWDPSRVVLEVAGAKQQFPVEKLLRLQPKSMPPLGTTPESYIELGDGTRFPTTSVTIGAHQAQVEAPVHDGVLQIPTDQIRILQLGSSQEQIPNWRTNWRDKQFTNDVLVILKKRGTEVDFLSGIVGDVTDDVIRFNWEGEQIDVKRSKVAAVTFYHAQSDLQVNPLCWLELQSGSRFPVTQLHQANGRLSIRTTLGLDFQLDQSLLRSADYSAGKLVYLSDLEPIRERWTPLIKLPVSEETARRYGQVRRDESLTGVPLTLWYPQQDNAASDEIRTYSKGLAIRSRTELEYRLPGSMQRFDTIAGIDPETRSQGSVLLSISANGETIFEEIIRGNEPPHPIDLDIAGKRRLKLIVDYGENLDLGDRLHLVEARLIK